MGRKKSDRPDLEDAANLLVKGRSGQHHGHAGFGRSGASPATGRPRTPVPRRAHCGQIPPPIQPVGGPRAALSLVLILYDAPARGKSVRKPALTSAAAPRTPPAAGPAASPCRRRAACAGPTSAGRRTRRPPAPSSG